MAADIKSALTAAAAISDQRHKIEQYKFLLSSIISTNNVSHAKAFVDHMVSDEVALVASRQLLQTFAQDLVKLDPEAHKEVAQYALMQIQPRVVSFEEQVSVIREGLAELYVNEEEWSKAAQMLSGIDLESGIRMLDDTYKLSKCVKIALLYLEIELVEGKKNVVVDALSRKRQVSIFYHNELEEMKGQYASMLKMRTLQGSMKR
ncbi:hypothetical protein L7F22_000706 [Adiantum nelumboides]|nr:hypothetical protein [Adiantum nelumboides]